MKFSTPTFTLWMLLTALLLIPLTVLAIDYQEPGWEIRCENDPFTGKSCLVIGKWGHFTMMGDPLVTLHMVYVTMPNENEAIFFTSRPNNYPGKPFMLKIDDHKPIIENSKAEKEGTFTQKKFPSLFDQIRTGKIMLVRYHTWPQGMVDARFDLTGFQDAVNQAQSKMNTVE